MKKITFRYKDSLSKDEWRTQMCVVESIEECIRIYGLTDADVSFEILRVEEV